MYRNFQEIVARAKEPVDVGMAHLEIAKTWKTKKNL